MYAARLLLVIDQPLLNLAPPGFTSSAFLLFVGALAFVHSWWKPAAAVTLLIGIGISNYMLTILCKGHATVRYAEEPLSVDLIQTLFLAVGPAFAIGWQIGCLKPHFRRIWLTAFWGIFLPLVVSACIAALMTQVGVSLAWHPSLYQDLTYALLGPDLRPSRPVWRFTLALVSLSLVGPALLCAVSVRYLSATFSTAKKTALAFSAGAVIVCLFATQSKPESNTSPPGLTLTSWTVFLTGLGVGTGFACLLRRPKRRPLNDHAN